MTAADVDEAQPATPEPPENDELPAAEDGQQTTEDDRQKEEPGFDAAGEVKNLRRAFHVHNVFYGKVNADGATFGAAVGGRPSSTSTGVLDPAEVTETLRGFLAPDTLAVALRVLRGQQFLVLVGPEGIGKHALALHLLRVVRGPEAEIVAASPARSLGQLAALEFRAGTGYVVTDHLATSEEVSVRRFEADRLSGLGRSRDAHIVLTTTSRRFGTRFLPSYAVTVEPPDPVETLHSHLAGADVEQPTLAMAAAYVRDEQRPREVARLARCLVSSPDAAVRAMRDVPADQVAAWFDRQVAMPELLSITALAIGGSQPESTHDALVRALRTHTENVREQREDAPHVPWHKDVPRQRDRQHDLVVVTADDDLDGDSDEDGRLSGRRVGFRRPEYRELVLRELHERYDDQLWHPVRNWLHDLCRIDPKAEIQTELAAALAILAKQNFVHIRQTFLAPWANGHAPERMTAAMVLWFMSEDDRLAPAALRTALSWGENKGLHRGVTSALALGGPLGVRFPDEAMVRLCFLSLRAKRIGDVAQEAMGALFAVAADQSSTATGRVLAMVRDELVRATARRDKGLDDSAGSYVTRGLEQDDAADDPDRERYERGWNGRIARAARSLVLAVLESEQQDSSKLVAAKILREQPEHTEQLGTLWAEVLCSSPHRADAIDALRRTLLSLADEQSATDAVARLGSAVYSATPAAHRPLRAAELIRAMTGAPRRVDRPPPALVSTLLVALHAATPRSARS